ncbi:unnamed protein product [marine sediment metagenome]|uniref:Uncharacterized protein n=1 Tax=marine sediment metagenome TaxID=412755 RepID=X1INY8_9ZZZZ
MTLEKSLKPKIAKKLNKKPGWFQEPMEHGLAAKGIKTKSERLQRAMTASTTPAAKKRFREKFPQFKEAKQGTKFKPGIEHWIPPSRRCVECARLDKEGKIVPKSGSPRKTVRKDIAARSLYKHGGLVSLRREYLCQVHRAKKPKKVISTAKTKRLKGRKEFKAFWESIE